MTIELRWLASFSASCFHAAAALDLGRAFADADLANAIDEPARLMAVEFDNCGLPRRKAFATFAELSIGIENNRELATVGLTKIRGRSDSTDLLARQLAGRIADLEAAVRRAKPNLADDLALRGGPLKDQWDARGPGMMMRLGELTDAQLVAPFADVALVYPATGGDGAAHLAMNSVRIEAVLVNAQPEIPEVVRLAWLLAQLQCDLPVFSDRIAADRIPLVASLAMLPPTLDAAAHVELVRDAAAALPLAVAAWSLGPTSSGIAGVPKKLKSIPAIADIVSEWWQTYLANPPDWPVAFGALDRMLR